MRKYIPLDSNFLDDPKVIDMIINCGSSGVAVFICVLTYLREAESNRISQVNLAQTIAFRLRMSVEDVSEALETAFASELLKLDGDLIYSSAFDARMQLMTDGNKKRSDAMKKRWQDRKSTEPIKSQESGSPLATEENKQAVEIDTVNNPEPKPRVDHREDVERIFSHWNIKLIKVHKEITPDLRAAIVKAKTKYTADGVCKAIDQYHKELTDPNMVFSYKWSLLDFLNRKNGLPVFYDKSANIIEERSAKSDAVKRIECERQKQRDSEKKIAEQMLSVAWSSFDTLDALLKHYRNLPDADSQDQYRKTMPERLQQIVLSPACGFTKVLTNGIPKTLTEEYERIKNAN